MNWIRYEKSIDGKGRVGIFGLRINVIDLGAIIFILSLLPIFIFGYKIWEKQKKPPLSKTTIEIPLNEYEKLKQKNTQIQDFLREHKRAKKYFR